VHAPLQHDPLTHVPLMHSALLAQGEVSASFALQILLRQYVLAGSAQRAVS
jgi:hypothetical protein